MLSPSRRTGVEGGVGGGQEEEFGRGKGRGREYLFTSPKMSRATWVPAHRE